MSTYKISKSSLLSLKAEINRKQEELNKAKLQNKIKKAQLKKPLEIKNKDVEQRKAQDGNEEDVNLLEKSRIALELKTKLYDKLSKRSNFTDEEIEHNRRFLVRFDKKNVRRNDSLSDSDNEVDVNKYPSDEEEHFSDEYEPAKNPDEEWVEYTDCLGRTRKCMRKDLEFLKSKDADLRETLDKTENKDDSPEKEISVKNTENQEKLESEFNEESELLSNDMRRELLRQQWEKEEEELKKKNDIHYQDILFNEARMHGVGYYGFSKDEEQRAKQQEALKNLREETEQKQKRAEELRNLREKQLAARAKAARNRKRARMGLPPEEDEPEIVQQSEEKPDEEKETEKQKEMEQKKEQEKEAARKRHIRPWDMGKEGVREHYECSQDEWNEKKRKERPAEFAPPSSYHRPYGSEPRDKDNTLELNKTLYFSTKKLKKKNDCENQNRKDNETFFVDTSKPPPTIRKHHINPYKTKETVSYEQTSTVKSKPIPIVNECEDFDEVQDRLFDDYKTMRQNSKSTDSFESDSESESRRGKGIEISPPPTFDYYGPSDTKRTKCSSRKVNLEDSIAAGLKFLRQQVEKKNTSSKHPSEMFLL
ncbi:hypothetical protein ILUMI_21052 [Ignelater luminosus]|uniref:CCDC174 alpha/beta GRSR domain-containing protein n=1 Tax=Ignelater luminosus TaxID=2038154 RepID=A0A8K0G498_IGNLU|nr:hypothetical protein ILUMI_21052 [Ignelater luminosus]